MNTRICNLHENDVSISVYLGTAYYSRDGVIGIVTNN